MADPRNSKERTKSFRRKLRYRGRFAQVLIYLGKLLRMFIYQSDWKVFPISALIAGLLAYVIRGDFVITMEGTLKGSFALACVCIWNGCFNSIQVICREREIIKREHRAGMHISSYVAAHMIYQALICLGQTVLMLYVFSLVKLELPAGGFITRWFRLDLGITLFLVTYAADMLALLVSAIVHNTTSAMTVMPFLLIFQLVFSGGIFSLPSWSAPLTKIAVSGYGLNCICAQAGYNELPMVAGWNTLKSMRKTRIGGEISLNQLLDYVSEEAGDRSELIADLRSTKVEGDLTVGEVLDFVAQDPNLEEQRQKKYAASVTVGELIDLFGEEQAKQAITQSSGQASIRSRYERSVENIVDCWITLGVYALLYAFIAVLFLEFIDKDKR